MLQSFCMTVKTIEKKVSELERRLRVVELGLKQPQRASRKPDPVWEQTRGMISKKKARAMLKFIAEQRRNSDRG